MAGRWMVESVKTALLEVAALFPLGLLTLGVVGLGDGPRPPRPTPERLRLFRPVLLACQAQMRADHPHDAPLTVDLDKSGMSRQVMRAGQVRWDIDGELALRGERTFFDCTAVGSGSGLTVISVTSPLWYTEPPF